ncbi:MAG: ABC transporter ATP-binding protein [Bdellovibrionales bacterium]|nr:ABC transporter ATP-binding protein [Bdellovibrionales bacterium]
MFKTAFWERFLERTALLRKYVLRYRRLMFFGMVMLVLVDLLEILPPILLKKAVDSVVDLKPYAELVKFAGIYFSVLLAQGVCRWGWRVFLMRSSMLAGRDLRGDFAEHLFGLPASFYDKNRVGDLMSLANSDVESIRQFLGPGLLTFADALFYLATVPVAMYWLSPELTLLALIPIPFIPYLVWKLEGAIHDRYKASQDQFSELSAMAQENLNGIRVVKAFARESTQTARFRSLGEEYVRLNLRLARVQSSFGPLMDFFASVGIVLLLWFGGKHVTTGVVTLGTFVAFQRYIQKMIWPMMALGFAASFYQRSLASSARMQDIFRQKTNILPPSAPKLPVAGGRGRIEVRDLTFAFPGTATPVLRNVSFTIEPGTRAAFVGKIGSGKSALLSLIPRIYPAPPGTIFVDGIAVEDWDLDALRAQIGFVSQEVFLFSDTVYENLGFGVHGKSVDELESTVVAAARLAAVDEDLRALPGGYSTLLGERGVNLSGGQKQRVSLARAIAPSPSILVLDDALSAVDVKTEEAILSGLRKRPGKNTELIAAHRISTVKEADQIFVLDQGAIVETGTHAALVKRKGIYAQFFEEQRLKEDLESYMKKMDDRLGIEPADAVADGGKPA